MERWLVAWKLTLVPFLLLGPCGSAAVPQKSYTIADFDGSGALASWRAVASGSPDSSAALTITAGHNGKGAVLAYSIRCRQAPNCDEYVAAVWHAKTPVPKFEKSTVSMWARFPKDIDVSLLVKDAGGNSLETPVPASLEHARTEGWGLVNAYPEAQVSRHAQRRLKKATAEIAIVVRSRRRIAVQGQLYLDDVMLNEKSGPFRLDPEDEGGQFPPSTTELTPIGVNIHLLRDDGSLDAARAAGFRFVRMDMLWANIERHGRFRFFPYDLLLRALEARGMGVLWILDYGHPDHGGGPPRSSQDIAAFSRFAEAAVIHFKGHNVRYKIWNEPDNPQFWSPSPDPVEYAALLREAVPAMRRADPSAMISSGGVSGVDLRFLSRAVDRAVGLGLTAVSVHPYPKKRPEAIVSDLGELRDWVTSELGESTEVWESEWGYSSSIPTGGVAQNGHTERGRRTQASLAVRQILTVWSLGFPLGVWYDLRDDGDDNANPEQNYGLLDSNGREKPAMKALRMLLTAGNERTFAGMVQEVPAGVHAMRLERAADRLFVVWTDGQGRDPEIEFATGNLLSATDLMGSQLKWKPAGAGHIRVNLNEDAGPVYLLFKQPSIKGAPERPMP